MQPYINPIQQGEMMIRLLHAADIHFGVTYERLNRSDRAFLRAEKRKSFTSMIDHAIKERVDFLCLSGDLFDINAADPTTKIYLQEQFDKLHRAGVSCYCIQGNHDAKHLNYFQHLRILSDRFDCIEKEHYRILGASYSDPKDSRDITALIPKVDHEKKNILLFHGLLSGSDSQSYHRLNPNDPLLKNIDYLALGHVHTPKEKPGKAQYPGSFFPQNTKEAGERGYLEVIISEGLDIRFHPSTDVQMVHKKIELYSTEEDFSVHHYKRIRSELTSDRHLYFITLVGRVEIEEYQQVKELISRVQEDYEREIHLVNDLSINRDFFKHPLLGELMDNLEDGLLERLQQTELLELLSDQMKEDIQKHLSEYKKLLLESFMEDTPWR